MVSREIAKLMVKNVRNFSDYNNLLSISCTGYASKNEDKDCILGLVYIGVMYNDIIKVHKKNFQERDRTKIIRLTVENMIKFSLNLIT